MAYYDKGRQRWRGSVYYKGVRKTKLFGYRGEKRRKDQKEAERWEYSTRLGLIRERAEKGRYSLKEAAADYLQHCEKQNFHRTTISNKKRFLQALEEEVGDIALERITPRTLKDFIYSRGKASQSNRARKDLSAFFSYCVKFFGLKENPLIFIDKLPEERAKQLVPNEKQVARLLLAVDRWDRNFLLAYLSTGARKEEILRWRWTDDIDFKRRQVRLGTKKSKTREMVYRWTGMDDILYGVLQDQYNTRLPESDYVFQNRRRNFKNYGDRFRDRRHFVRKICKRINRAEAKKEGGGDPVPMFGYHSLRRFYTSVLAEEGTKIPTLQRLLGHSRPSTTEIYVKSISEDIQAAQEKVGAVLDRLMNGEQEEGKEEQNSK
jgi:integrase